MTNVFVPDREALSQCSILDPVLSGVKVAEISGREFRTEGRIESMENFIELKVVTTGEDIDERFNVNQKLLVVFNRALAAVGGSANRDMFTLEFNDEPLDLERSISDYIEELGWVDCTVLELVPRPEVV